MSRIALPCIACGRELRNVSDDSDTNQPHCGTAFTSHGHYGSTAFDPMDGHYLEINVCDLCLSQHQERVMEGRDYRLVMEEGVVTGTEMITPRWKLVPWRIGGTELDWINSEARRAFELAVDDEVDEPVA